MMIYQRMGSEQLSSPKIKILEVTNKNREIENSKGGITNNLQLGLE